MEARRTMSCGWMGCGVKENEDGCLSVCGREGMIEKTGMD